MIKMTDFNLFKFINFFQFYFGGFLLLPRIDGKNDQRNFLWTTWRRIHQQRRNGLVYQKLNRITIQLNDLKNVFHCIGLLKNNLLTVVAVYLTKTFSTKIFNCLLTARKYLWKLFICNLCLKFFTLSPPRVQNNWRKCFFLSCVTSTINEAFPRMTLTASWIRFFQNFQLLLSHN